MTYEDMINEILVGIGEKPRDNVITDDSSEVKTAKFLINRSLNDITSTYNRRPAYLGVTTSSSIRYVADEVTDVLNHINSTNTLGIVTIYQGPIVKRSGYLEFPDTHIDIDLSTSGVYTFTSIRDAINSELTSRGISTVLLETFNAFDGFYIGFELNDDYTGMHIAGIDGSSSALEPNFDLLEVEPTNPIDNDELAKYVIRSVVRDYQARVIGDTEGYTYLNQEVEIAWNNFMNYLTTKEVPSVFLDEARIEILSRGWWFNEEDKWTLVPDGNQYIDIPYNVLNIDKFYSDKNLSVRDNRLYDVVNQTFRFSESVECSVIFNVAYDNLPPVVQGLVEVTARIHYINELINVYNMKFNGLPDLEVKQGRLFSEVHREDLANRDTTLVDTYELRRY